MYDFNNVKYYGSQIMHIYIRKFHNLSIHLDLKLQNKFQQIYLILKKCLYIYICKPRVNKIIKISRWALLYKYMDYIIYNLKRIAI